MRFEHAICVFGNASMAIYLAFAIPVAYAQGLAWLVGVDASVCLFCLAFTVVALKKFVTYKSGTIDGDRG